MVSPNKPFTRLPIRSVSVQFITEEKKGGFQGREQREAIAGEGGTQVSLYEAGHTTRDTRRKRERIKERPLQAYPSRPRCRSTLRLSIKVHDG